MAKAGERLELRQVELSRAEATPETDKSTRVVRVLLVDDNEDFRRAIFDVLRPSPAFAIVGEAIDSIAALRQIARLTPDVVLMDVSLPVMNGLEATRLVNQLRPGIRVIMLLPMVSDEYQTAAIASGALCSIAKERVVEELVPTLLAVTTHFGPD